VTALGVPAERIALFPSWTPAALSLRSHRGRAVFRDHAVYVDAPPLRQFDTWTDVSAGAWRSFVFGTDASRWPAVHPQHERRKYLAPDGRSIARFVGLGRFGEALRERAERLADADFGARVRALRSGFLTLEWTGGNPLSAGDAEQPHVLARIATYLATLRRQFASGAPARTDDLAAMIEVNLGEAGASIPLDAATLLDAASGFDQPAIALDGRMMPHEWVSGGRRLLKVDALDHHADDFLPGARDIAWDLAGAIAELRLDGDATNFFVDCYRRVSADHSIDRRLPFYRLAYLAYRLGYVSLAADTLANTADAHAFSLLRARYRRSLAALGQTRRPARARSRSPGRPRCDG
jgi:hypothetical protein